VGAISLRRGAASAVTRFQQHPSEAETETVLGDRGKDSIEQQQQQQQ